MRDYMSILSNIGQNIMLKAKDFKTVAEYVAYIFNNADNFKASIGMDDQQLTNLEELLVFAYKLGYKHGEDFMDGKRPEDTPLPFYQDQYSEYGGD